MPQHDKTDDQQRDAESGGTSESPVIPLHPDPDHSPIRQRRDSCRREADGYQPAGGRLGAVRRRSCEPHGQQGRGEQGGRRGKRRVHGAPDQQHPGCRPATLARRRPIQRPRLISITTENQAAAATTDAARRSSTRPTSPSISLPATRKKASRSRWTIVRHPLCEAAGRTQADNVSPEPTSNEADAGTRTMSLAPSKLKAFPYRPRAPCRSGDPPHVAVARVIRHRRPRPLIEGIRPDQPRGGRPCRSACGSDVGLTSSGMASRYRGRHVGSDLGLSEGTVVNTCLVDQPVEILPVGVVATEPQRVLGRLDRPGRRPGRHLGPVNEQSQCRAVIGQGDV